MFIGISKNYRIKQIAESAEGIVSPSLTVIEIDREAVFGNWTDRRILAYCYKPLETGYSIYPGRDLTQVDIEDNKEATEKVAQRVDTVEPVTSIAFVALAETNVIDEQTAVKHKEQFDGWTGGVKYKVDQMRVYADRLYKCRQEHTSEAHQTPDLIPAIWKVIDLEHAGTLDDPIPAVVNMEYIKGKYYIEDGVIYLMNREGMVDGERIVLAFTPSQLVGHYFVVVDDNVEEVATDNAEVV